VRALMQMRRERERRLEQAGNIRLAIQEAERSGKLVVEAQGIIRGVITNCRNTIS
jgi:ABC transport system ATP-binding/permease protein